MWIYTYMLSRENKYIFQHIFKLRLRNGVVCYSLLIHRHRKKHYSAIRGTRLKNLLEKYLLFSKNETRIFLFHPRTLNQYHFRTICCCKRSFISIGKNINFEVFLRLSTLFPCLAIQFD